MTPHQMGHDYERDAVYLAALTGIIANPEFFGGTLKGGPGGAALFASSVVAEVFGDTKATGEAGQSPASGALVPSNDHNRSHNGNAG